MDSFIGSGGIGPVMRKYPCLYRLPLRKRGRFSSDLCHPPILSRQRRDLPAGSQNKASALLFRILGYSFSIRHAPRWVHGCPEPGVVQGAIRNLQSAIGRWAFQLIPGEGCANKIRVLKIHEFGKKSENGVFRHSGESRNPVLFQRYDFSGLRFAPE
jgi:hypothetical protein